MRNPREIPDMEALEKLRDQAAAAEKRCAALETRTDELMRRISGSLHRVDSRKCERQLKLARQCQRYYASQRSGWAMRASNCLAQMEAIEGETDG